MRIPTLALNNAISALYFVWQLLSNTPLNALDGAQLERCGTQDNVTPGQLILVLCLLPRCNTSQRFPVRGVEQDELSLLLDSYARITRLPHDNKAITPRSWDEFKNRNSTWTLGYFAQGSYIYDMPHPTSCTGQLLSREPARP